MPRATPPASGQSEEWDDAYLAVLGSQDVRQLRELLSRSNPEIVMPLNGPSPLSQAVMLTLVHRVCGYPRLRSLAELAREARRAVDVAAERELGDVAHELAREPERRQLGFGL